MTPELTSQRLQKTDAKKKQFENTYNATKTKQTNRESLDRFFYTFQLRGTMHCFPVFEPWGAKVGKHATQDALKETLEI